MLEAMGINRLIRYSPTPTMINITTTFSKGMLYASFTEEAAIRRPIPLRRRVSLYVRRPNMVEARAPLFASVYIITLARNRASTGNRTVSYIFHRCIGSAAQSGNIR
jgi:hypothetical protein